MQSTSIAIDVPPSAPTLTTAERDELTSTLERYRLVIHDAPRFSQRRHYAGLAVFTAARIIAADDALAAGRGHADEHIERIVSGRAFLASIVADLERGVA